MLQFCILKGCLEKRQTEELSLKRVLGRNAEAERGWCFSRSRVDCVLIVAAEGRWQMWQSLFCSGGFSVLFLPFTFSCMRRMRVT